MSKSLCVAKRLAFDATFVALYYVLARFVSVNVGLQIRITLDGLPIILCTLFMGLSDGLSVALIGSFLYQATSEYGLSPTTPLWMAPAIGRALFVGIAVLSTEVVKKDKIGRVGICVIVALSSIFVTVLNTLAIYIDSCIISNYGSVAKIFGINLAIRLAGSLLSTVAYLLLVIPLYRILSEFFGKFCHPEHIKEGELEYGDD